MRNWRKDSRTTLSIAPVLICFFVIASRFIRNGTYFGLDFNLYQPDGRYYTWLTYKFLQKTDTEAWDLATHFYSNLHLISNHYANTISPVKDLALRHDIQFRPLYPFLSVPFVALFGAKGMLVVPSVSYLLCSYLSYNYLKLNKQRILGVFGLAILAASPFLARGFITNYTDSLLALIVLTVFLQFKRNSHIFWLVAFLSFLGEITRPSEPIWLLFSIYFFWSSRKKRFLILGLIHVAIFCSAFLVNPDSVGASSRGGVTVMHRVLFETPNVLKILIIDNGELIVLDKVLLLLFLGFIILSVQQGLKIPSINIVFGLLAITVAMAAWNGGVGTGWRYEIPCVFPMYIVVIEVLATRINFRNEKT